MAYLVTVRYGNGSATRFPTGALYERMADARAHARAEFHRRVTERKRMPTVEVWSLLETVRDRRLTPRDPQQRKR